MGIETRFVPGQGCRWRAEREAVGSAGLGLNAWSHLASTYDGAEWWLWREWGVASSTARIVVDELGRLRRLAERLVTLASAEQPDFLRLTDVDVEPMVVDVVHRWTPTPRRWTLRQLDEARVLADPDRLALALDAIIENAVKHTKPDDPIELSVERGNGRVAISVADGGSGIARDDLDRVFERFAKAGDGSRVPGRRGRGHGLGLAIVKTVVEAHGGPWRSRARPARERSFASCCRSPAGRRAPNPFPATGDPRSPLEADGAHVSSNRSFASIIRRRRRRRWRVV